MVHNGIKEFYWLLACLLPVMTTGCGGNDNNQPGPSTSAGGQGGASAASTQGTSVAGATNSGGSSSTGGTSSGTPVEVFNQELTKPSFDCRMATDKLSCVSVSGLYKGQAVDRVWSSVDKQGALWLMAPRQWIIGQPESGDFQVGYFFDVGVPASPNGPFLYDSTSTTDTWIGSVRFALDGVGGDSHSTNFVSGQFAGIASVDPSTKRHIVAGTFQAKWSEPSADPCIESGRLAIFDYCAGMAIHGTFRGEFTGTF